MKILNRIYKYIQPGRSWYQRPVGNITKITVHHSARQQGIQETYEQMLNAHAQAHKSRGWPGLAYHFVIDEGGNIYQMNNYTDITWHDAVNADSIGIMLNGYMHPPYNDKPTQAQLNSLKELLDHLCTEHPEFPADHDDVLGHRDRVPTACPGDNLYSYVKEYRDKRGRVSWGKSGTTQNRPDTKSVEEKKIQNYDKIAKYNSYYAELNVQADRVINDLRARQAELESKNKQIEELDKANKELDKTIRTQGEQLIKRGKQIKELEGKIKDLETNAIDDGKMAAKQNQVIEDQKNQIKLLKVKEEQGKKLRQMVEEYQESLKVCQARTEPTTWLGKVLYDLAYGRRPRIWTQQQ